MSTALPQGPGSLDVTAYGTAELTEKHCSYCQAHDEHTMEDCEALSSDIDTILGRG